MADVSPQTTRVQHKILVVDDDVASREVVAVSLEMQGFDVATAEDGDRALNMAKRIQYDLILLDVNMPETNGYEVLHAIRSMPSRAKTPVVMLTANGFDPEGMVQEALGGASGHVSKPFSQAVLRDAVISALESDDEEHEKRRVMRRRAAAVYRSVIDLRAFVDAETEPEQDKGRFRRRGK